MATEGTTITEGIEIPAQGADDPATEVVRLREELAKARKWEDRAKANSAAAKELETFKQQSMSETERAVEAARNEGRSEGTKAASERIVRADVRAAAAGRNVDVDALLDGINFARFVDQDGESDLKAISAWMDKIAPPSDGTRVPPGRPGPRNAELKRTPADEFADFINSQRRSAG